MNFGRPRYVHVAFPALTGHLKPVTALSADQIALPDFDAGAMENWGLVTYRESALLFDPQLSSTGNKERVSTVISHELAHMVRCCSPPKPNFSAYHYPW